jgi:Fur family ferric uptake transcriptional regulator
MKTIRLQRTTRQRQLILEELRKTCSHPTALEVFDMVRRRLPRLSLGTVYRNLELMAEAGMIQKLDFGGGQARFDGNPQNHDHLRCLRCGRIDDLEPTPLAALLDGSQDRGGYQILGRRLELLGICPECQRNDL